MTYKPKSKAWFRKQIGQRIYRDSGGNPECCKGCYYVVSNGIVVTDEGHAEYLATIDAEFASCGTYLNYRDKK